MLPVLDSRVRLAQGEYCSLTAQGSTVVYPVQVRVNSLSRSQVRFNIQVSETPGHFTPPG
ncbi:MAG TPA: hypothetical protein VFQ68_34095 [Streptosporangiaceae bacterium]|nr:hypothetical protein [Streptosporangiaceae bacterium]